MNDINEETPMTDSQLKHLNRLYLLIRNFKACTTRQA